MEYTWFEFCKVEKDFREEIAAISHDLKGRQLNASDILIVNIERNCANPNKTKQGIDVWFVALGSDAVTIQIGNDLKDLLDSRQLGKLGNRFETKVMLCFVRRKHSQAYETGVERGIPSQILENQRNSGK
jgi:hypothetical protein